MLFAVILVALALAAKIDFITANGQNNPYNKNFTELHNSSHTTCVDYIREGRPHRTLLSIELMSSYYKQGKINSTYQLLPHFSNHLPTLGGVFLHSAVSMKKLDLIKDLIRIDSYLDIPDNHGITPLYKAIDNNFNEAADILKICGANVNFSVNGYSLLHRAVSVGSLRMVEKLAELGATIDAQNTRGYTPLYVAIKKNRKDIVQCLIRKGANKNSLSRTGKSLLHTAVLEGDFDAVCNILNLGVEVNTIDIYQHTPLYTSIYLNHTEITEALLESGANVNFLSEKGLTLLHTAVSEGFIYVVQKLIDLGVNVSTSDESGYTAIHRAIETDNLEMLLTLMRVQKLPKEPLHETGDYPIHYAVRRNSISCIIMLSEFVNFTVQNNKGLTPFALAVYLNRSTIIGFFLDNLPIPDISLMYTIFDGELWRTPLHVAVIDGNYGAVENMLKFGADVNKKDKEGKTPLWMAVEGNHSALIDLFISKGAIVTYKIDRMGDSMLHIAIKNKCIKCAESLIKAGLNVNVIGKLCLSPLLLALTLNDEHIIKYLESKGAEANFKPCTLEQSIISTRNGSLSSLKSLLDIMVENEEYNISRKSVEFNEPEILRYLLGKGKTVDPIRQKALLHVAVKKGNVEAIKVLMELGIGAEGMNDIDGLLTTAMENRHPKAMEALIKHGADINSTVKISVSTPSGVIKKSWSLLHQAAYINAVEEAVVLLDNGLDVNIKDPIMWTPLHVASMTVNLEIAELLIQRGADINAKTIHGYTALYIAQSKGSKKMVKLLSCQA